MSHFRFRQTSLWVYGYTKEAHLPVLEKYFRLGRDKRGIFFPMRQKQAMSQTPARKEKKIFSHRPVMKEYHLFVKSLNLVPKTTPCHNKPSVCCQKIVQTKKKKKKKRDLTYSDHGRPLQRWRCCYLVVLTEQRPQRRRLFSQSIHASLYVYMKIVLICCKRIVVVFFS